MEFKTCHLAYLNGLGQMKVDLLCVNYNTKDKLIRFIDTLQSDWGKDAWSLSIADNDSEDGSVEWLKENAEYYPIDHLYFNDNIGYSQAINSMASKTDNDILCAVNADTWFTTNHVLEMIDMFKEHENITIAGPKQLDENNRIRHGGIFWAKQRGYKTIHRGWNEIDADDSKYRDLVECWTVSGSIYYVRRNAWDEMTNHPEYRKLYPDVKGAFLPTKHYFEETFCSQWAQKLGYEVWYNGVAETAGHTWHGSSEPGEASRKFFQTSQRMYIDACNSLEIVHEC